MRVLITGVGGAIAIGAIKALRWEFDRKITIIGIDSSPFSSSFYIKGFLDNMYVVPEASSPHYIKKVLQICRKERIDILFPCTDHELLPLSLNRKKFADIGVKVVVSSPRTIKICRDKWLTYKNLRDKLPIVKSALPSANMKKILQNIGLPAIIKPRMGWGSRDVHIVYSYEDAEVLSKRIKKPILQKYIDGEEYTIDGFATHDGKIVYVIPRKRIRKFAGLSFQGMTIRDEELINLGKRIASVLKLIGPFNFQVRKTTKGREVFIFEINPRFSGTGILSVKAGINIPALALRDIKGENLPSTIDFKENLIITRYIEDLFVSKEDLLDGASQDDSI